jgi:hypothetical protein
MEWGNRNEFHKDGLNPMIQTPKDFNREIPIG